VLIENNRAVGVEYQSAGGRQTARARAEVIVSGGAYGSPKLLLLSGLGPAAHLQAMGVPVLWDMPMTGVSEALAARIDREIARRRS
jgi:choline dehydrogenase